MISDLGLPDLSGNDLMRRLKSRYDFMGIAVSGYGMEEDVAEARPSGFSHHQTKPIDLSRLAEVIADVPLKKD